MSVIKVVSFNIRNSHADDGPNSWAHRRERSINAIRKLAPDVIGLQEVCFDQRADLENSLSDYIFVGSARDDGALDGEVALVGFLKNRFHLLESRTFWLSDTPELPGSSTWGNRCVRTCTACLLHDIETNDCFRIYNTHLDHESEESRLESARLIRDRVSLDLPQYPAIVTGDFNVGESHDVLKTFSKSLLRDTFRIVNADAKIQGTFPDYGNDTLHEKIDYILTDVSWEVLSASIETDLNSEGWISDHYPVSATLELAV